MKSLFYLMVLLCSFLHASSQGTWHTMPGATTITTNNIYIVLNNMNLLNNGSFVQGTNTGTTIINGNTNTTTAGAGTTVLDKFEVTVDNGFSHTLQAAVSIKNVITLTSGQLASNGFLKLKSDSSNTARVGPVTSTVIPAISGNVVTERYIAGRRKYRLITSSVTTSELATLTTGQENFSIWGNWQNLANNSTTNTGTIITGGTPADGFDQQTSNVSMYTYDAAGRRFTGFSSALGKNTKYTPLKAGVSYYIFVFGDRTNTITTSSPKSTVLTQTGTLLMGDQIYNTNSPNPLSDVIGRYTLLGNPFASPINWASVAKTNISNTFWGWDPNLSSTGGFITVTTIGASIVISPLTGTTAINQFIQSGQGFFVKTTGPSPALTIGEQHKSGNTNNNVFRTAGGNSLPLIAVNLQYQTGSTTILADGALAIFDSSFSNQSGPEDAAKMPGNKETVSLQNGMELLSINGQQMPANNDTLFINLASLTRPQYTLQIFAKHLDNTVVPYLEDNYLHTSQQLTITDTNWVAVNINADAGSYDSKRFQIVFRPSMVLPIKFTSVQATKYNKEVEVEWTLADVEALKDFEIERSSNGVDFVKKGVTAAQTNPVNLFYHWTDTDPALYNYYRVRAVKMDGQYLYSKVVTAKMALQQPTVEIFPNPIQNKTIQLTMKGVESGKYVVKVVNMIGHVLYSTSMQHERNTETHSVQLNARLPLGSYVLDIRHVEHTNISFRKQVIIR